MSLRGRYVIDSLKRGCRNSSFFGRWRMKLPVPPFEQPSYWEGVYRSLGPDDVHEWGGIRLEDVLEYRFDARTCATATTTTTTTTRRRRLNRSNFVDDDNERIDEPSPPAIEKTTTTTTWGETIGVFPSSSSYSSSSTSPTSSDRGNINEDPVRENETYENSRPILVLGCGNSKLGEDLVAGGWRPVVQTDVSSRVVESVSHRPNVRRYLRTGDMQLVQDDATVLSAFEDSTVQAVVDKGLLDALYCADHYQQCRDVLRAVRRVLKPGGIFATFSFSEPEFLLEQILFENDGNGNGNGNRSYHERKRTRERWDDVEVRRLDSILLYRFRKPSLNRAQQQQQQLQLLRKGRGRKRGQQQQQPQQRPRRR